MDILVVGSAVTDLVFEVEAFPDQPEKYAASAAQIVGGGCAGNAAVGISRLGGRAMLVARMGQDLVGDLTIADLEREGVDCALVQRNIGGQSAFSSVFVRPDAERQIMAFRGKGLADKMQDIRPNVAAVLVDTRWPQAAHAALLYALKLGVPGVLDGEAPVAQDLVETASHVAFSAQGLRDFTGQDDLDQALETAAKKVPGWLCVTDGAHGTRTPDAHHPTFPITPLDTLGAGDIWHGAFTLRLAEGATETEAIRFASAAAALKCTRSGGRKGAPTRNETDAFLKRTNT